MKRKSEESKRAHSIKKLGSWISGFAIVCVLGFSGTASAAVAKHYVLTPDSKLVTTVSAAEDFITDTGGTPNWFDEALAAPPVSYGTDVPQVTENIMTVVFPTDASGQIIDGTITITRMDWYHPTDASFLPFATILGINDSTVSGAVGTMVGGVVAGWTNDLDTGLVHKELTCVNLPGGTLCGTFGLPLSGDTMVTHAPPVIAIDTAGVPDVGSLPMTFSSDFGSVTMEMTIATSPSRKYYSISGTEATFVPASNTGLRLLMIGLLALAGVFVLGRARVSAFAMRDNEE